MALRALGKLILFIPCGIFLSILTACGRPQASYTEPPRAMWVWDAKIFQYDEAAERLFNFCGEKNINLLFYTAYKVTGSAAADYRRFNRTAHKRGIAVQALAGDPRWCLEKYHHRALEWVADVIKFNAESKQEERFDGIHSDVEPYIFSKLWEEDHRGMLRQYMGMNAAIEKMLNPFKPDFVFAADIPFWYDDDPEMWIEWNNEFKPASYHILDTVGQIAVMDYRNFAAGDNGSIALAKNEIDYADKAGKKVYIGQETKRNLQPEYITFGDKDEMYMEGEIAKLAAVYKDRPSFAGIAIHHYLSYKRLIRNSRIRRQP